VRGRNTENIDTEYNIMNGLIQHKYRAIHKFAHYQKHITFSRDKENYNKKFIHEDVKVIIGIMR
jgi:hypothetical protein